MSTFTGVVTTGIYCRPGCGGRPKPENVRVFTTAAAAEAAGYRACLRCRPYRGEPPVGPPGSELVCRAVGLIVDGMLDGCGEAELAARLGASARHLRRLFADSLGITPDQLARSSRVHFARRLLDDTDLTVLDVAFASGFGSVRQLNRAFHESFHASPTALRKRRRSTDRLVADGGLLLRLSDRQPLDFEPMLDYLAERAIPGVEHVDGGTYRRTITVDGHPGVLEIFRGPDGSLLLRAHLPDLHGLIHQVRRARHIFALDRTTPTQPTEDHASNTPLRQPPGTWDAYETAVRTLVEQGLAQQPTRPTHTRPNRPDHTATSNLTPAETSQLNHTGRNQPDYIATNQPNNPSANPPDHIDTNQRDHTPTNQPDHTTTNQPNNPSANPPDHIDTNQRDHPDAPGLDHASANPLNHTATNQRDHPDAGLDHASANPLDHAGTNQPDHAGANQLVGRIVARHGTAVPGLAPLGLGYLFPPPRALAEADLTGLDLPSEIARTVQTFARAVAEGDIHLDRTQPLHTLLTTLTGVPGITPATAHYIASRLGEPTTISPPPTGRQSPNSRTPHTFPHPVQAVVESARTNTGCANLRSADQ
ncbi:helix-turn-helix domain-containing protein [Nocardia mexicana]|nr:helix-turn-helix domain-containing protein [Nocardia mexicana]